MLAPCPPIISTGPCPLTVAGPYAAWMPRKSLQGCTCGVSCDGGRARALQPCPRSAALQPATEANSPRTTKHTRSPAKQSHKPGARMRHTATLLSTVAT
ncbi:hypothetical protein XarbCFBP8132_06435 [Xanthomonas arboricola]|nr:hypothetical protein XarbCFBP8132_06435 [Xanthomonas arboricola]